MRFDGLQLLGDSVASDFSIDLKHHTEDTVSVTATSTTTLNCAAATVFDVNLAASITTLSFTNLPPSGNAYTATLLITNGGNKLITWPASVKFPGGTPPTLTATAGKIDVVTLLTVNGGTTWLAFVGGLNF